MRGNSRRPQSKWLVHYLQGGNSNCRQRGNLIVANHGESGTGAKVAKDRTGPDLDERPSISLFTEPGDSCRQINPFSPTRRRPTVDYSLVAGDAQRHQFQACLPYGHHAQYQSFYVRKLRKPCQNLGRAGDRYGVLASGKLWKGGRDLNSETFRWNPAGANPAWQSWTCSPKRVLRGGGATHPAKRRQ